MAKRAIVNSAAQICLLFVTSPTYIILYIGAMESDVGFKTAFDEALKGSHEGGVPIGAALVSADGKLLGQGHNMRIQKGSPTLHVCSSPAHCR